MTSSGNPTSWAHALLSRLGIKPNPANVKALVGWAQAEGGHWKNQARFNPLNTTQPAAGAGNTGSQGNIKAYRSWQQGLDATVQTLRNGRYNGILQALRGNDPGAVAQAIGRSPWGTSAGLVRQTIGGATPSGEATPLASPAPTSRTRTIPGVDRSSDRKALLLNYLERSHDPNALLSLGAGLKDAQDTPSRTVTESTGSAAGGGSKGRSKLLELFWQGQGGIDVKNGQKVPQGFVSGHTDHVHVAAGPKTVIQLGELAQRMGLTVGENSHFTGHRETSGHAPNSYHYKDQAIDVSGDPAAMRAYARRVARLYGIK